MKKVLAIIIGTLIIWMIGELYVSSQLEWSEQQVSGIVKNNAVVSFRLTKPKKVARVTKKKKKKVIRSTFLETYAPSSPLIPYKEKFYSYGEKGKIALAIAGNETLFGTTPNTFNAWGYGCNYGGVRFDCGWRDWNYAIKRYIEIADNYLSIFDGTKESVRRIAQAGYYKVGMDGSNQKNQDDWVNHVYWFYTQL